MATALSVWLTSPITHLMSSSEQSSFGLDGSGSMEVALSPPTFALRWHASLLT